MATFNHYDQAQAQPGYNQGEMSLEKPHTSFQVAEGDYRCSCVGSCLCPCCGLVGTLCCCNTLPGKHGVFDGCKISFTISLIAWVIVAILVYTSSIDCKKDKTAKNTKEKDCKKIKQANYDTATKLCHFNGHCPSKYTFQNTTKDGTVGWCKNNDHYTCLGAGFKAQPWVSMGIYVVLLVVAIFFARHYYNLRLQQSGRTHA